MLGACDKVTFTITNIMDKAGNIIHDSIKLPLEDEIELPENVYKLSVFEAHEGYNNNGFIAFEIFIGKKTTISEIFKRDKQFSIECATSFKSINNYCICEEKNDRINIISACQENDMAVSNVETLKILLKYISAEVEVIKLSTNKIKGLHIM